MGDRHNRKRTRHRPIRRQRLCQQLDNTNTNIASTPISTLDQTPSSPACSCWRPSTRPPLSTTISTKSTLQVPQLPCAASVTRAKPGVFHTPETPLSRTRRVFGGAEDESAELCGPMLDVVLGLFGGIDYDDDETYLR